MLTVVPCTPCLAYQSIRASNCFVFLSLQSMRSSGMTCQASLSTVTRSLISGKKKREKMSKLTFFSSVLGLQHAGSREKNKF